MSHLVWTPQTRGHPLDPSLKSPCLSCGPGRPLSPALNCPLRRAGKGLHTSQEPLTSGLTFSLPSWPWARRSPPAPLALGSAGPEHLVVGPLSTPQCRRRPCFCLLSPVSLPVCTTFSFPFSYSPSFLLISRCLLLPGHPLHCGQRCAPNWNPTESGSSRRWGEGWRVCPQLGPVPNTLRRGPCCPCTAALPGRGLTWL